MLLLMTRISMVTFHLELDTGASMSLISVGVWKEAFPESELVKYDNLLKTYTG